MTLSDQIKRFENKTGYQLSTTLKQTLEIVNGLEGESISKIETFENWIPIKKHLWFEDVEFSEKELSIIKDTFVIGDIMINSHQWGIKLNKDGSTEYIMELDTYDVVSDSLKEFIEKFKIEPYYLVK